jgi:hypothetical protein
VKGLSPLNDLFAIFPDLPRLPKRSVDEGARRMRLKAELMRQTIARNTVVRRAAVQRVKAHLRERTITAARPRATPRRPGS